MQATAGGNLTFLRDNILYHEDELLAEARQPDVFKIFDQIAGRVPPGGNGVLYTPWTWGARAPVEDHALRAVGLVTLASMLGVALGMVLTPILADMTSIATLQLVYGLLAAATAVAFLALARERPATLPCPPGMDERTPMFDGLKHCLRVRPFLVMLGVAFIVIALVVVATVPGMFGVAFASSTWLLFASGAALGFFLVAVLPIGMQYAAEITHPTPEGTSNGLIQLCGQVSVVYVYVMAALRTADHAFTVSLVLSAALLALGALVVSRLRDAASAQEGHAAVATVAAKAP